MNTRDLTQAIMLRPAEVERLYGIDQSTICRWCRAGTLKSVKIGGARSKGMRLIRRADLDLFLESNTGGVK